MFLVFYTVKIVYICVFMTFSTSYCLSDTLMDPRKVCTYVCVYICMYYVQYILSLLLFVVSSKNKFKLNSDVCNINNRQKYNFHQPSSNLSLYQNRLSLLSWPKSI